MVYNTFNMLLDSNIHVLIFFILTHQLLTFYFFNLFFYFFNFKIFNSCMREVLFFSICSLCYWLEDFHLSNFKLGGFFPIFILMKLIHPLNFTFWFGIFKNSICLQIVFYICDILMSYLILSNISFGTSMELRWMDGWLYRDVIHTHIYTMDYFTSAITEA